MSMQITEALLRDSFAIHKQAMASLLEQLDSLCEGAITVDRKGRIAWINDKYLAMLDITDPQQALGRDIEEIIPNSMMRDVMRNNQPLLLDILTIGTRAMVVTRMPLHDAVGQVIGAVGFVLLEKMHHLTPLLAKFSALQAELGQAQRDLAKNSQPKHTLDSFVGDSLAVQNVKRLAMLAAQQGASVLLCGESGTGKDIIASAIHAASQRACAPCVSINVAAVPEARLEAALLGVALAADQRVQEGAFQQADGGTLFLDAIDALPLPMQGKLLHVLQEQEVKLPGLNAGNKVDVRMIAATSVDLRDRMRDGLFRSDLYYQLNVLPIALPPLRQRLDDLPMLCQALLEQICSRSGLAPRRIGPGALPALRAYHWPGNVRELANILERACILSDQAELDAIDFAFLAPNTAPAATNYADALTTFDRTIIQAALLANDGHVPAAARQLGLSRATLYKRIAALGLAGRAAVRQD